MLAPIAAKLLRVPTVAHVRISRYADDLYSPLGMARVVVDQLRGRHDAKYTLRDPPDAAVLRGQRVLIIDDALASGGTLRAAHRFCVDAGAASVHGVALKIIRGYWDPEGDDQRRPRAKELRIPCFVPWGTF